MHFNKLFQTIDYHVDGEPLRIITGGFPDIEGKTQLERRFYAMEHLDDLRKVLMYEPRGHHGMYGCIITPPASENADFGVLFMHNEGWSTMCGHGIIAVVTMVIDTGRFEVSNGMRQFIIDSPAGEVKAIATVEDGKVRSVACEHVPSFVLYKDIPVRIMDWEFKVDVSFGGAFYIIVNSSDVGLKVSKRDLPALQTMATRIKMKIEQDYEIVHPLEKGLKGIYGVIFSDYPVKSDSDLRNVTIFADEQVDRSACGTGTAARLASLLAHGKIGEGAPFVHESITDGQFVGEIIGTVKVGEKKAINPLVSGRAFPTGIHQFMVDPEDLMPHGFLLEK